MSKYFAITLPVSVAELRLLLSVLADAAIEGNYYGNRTQYWKRHGRITKKLADAARIAGMTYEPFALSVEDAAMEGLLEDQP